MELLIRGFLQNAAPGLVTKELTHGGSCTRCSTHNSAILAILDRLVLPVIATRPSYLVLFTCRLHIDKSLNIGSHKHD